jgi:hypothetical protein
MSAVPSSLHFIIYIYLCRCFSLNSPVLSLTPDQEAVTRVHNSHAHVTRVMRWSDSVTRPTLAELSTPVETSSAEIIPQLVAQAKAEDVLQGRHRSSMAHAGRSPGGILTHEGGTRERVDRHVVHGATMRIPPEPLVSAKEIVMRLLSLISTAVLGWGLLLLQPSVTVSAKLTPCVLPLL